MAKDPTPSDPKPFITSHICDACGEAYNPPPPQREGHSFWQCPHCEHQESIHITPRRRYPYTEDRD